MESWQRKNEEISPDRDAVSPVSPKKNGVWKFIRQSGSGFSEFPDHRNGAGLH